MIKQIRNSMLLSSLAYLVFGLILFIFPDSSLKGISYGFGAILTVCGLYRLFQYYRGRKEAKLFGGDLVLGVLLILAGVFLLVFPKVIVSILPVCFGILFLVYGISELLRALDLKKLNAKSWISLFFFGAVSTIFGAVVLFNPFSTMAVTIRIIGILLLVTAVTNVISVISLYHTMKNGKKAEEEWNKNFRTFFWF